MPSPLAARRSTATPTMAASAEIAVTSAPISSIKEVTQWVSGSKYARYTIEKPTKVNTSPTKNQDADGEKGRGVSPNSVAKAYNRLGAGLTLSAGHGGMMASRPRAEGTLASLRVGDKPILDNRLTSAEKVDNDASDCENPRSLNSTQNLHPLGPTSQSTLLSLDPQLAASRAKLEDRTHYLQAALDARGSQYVCKIGKLSTTWLFGNNKSCERKARTPPRSRSPNITDRQESQKSMPQLTSFPLAGAASRNVTRVPKDQAVGSSSLDFSGSLSNHTLNSNTDTNTKGGSTLGGSKRQFSAPLVRQHLAASFGSVHLSPNSSTAVVMHKAESPRAKAIPTVDALGTTNGDTAIEALSTSSRGENLTARSPRSSSMPDSSNGVADMGAHPPVAELVRSTTPPRSPLHGGCYHNQQQHPRLFPALLGPYQNPRYYTRTSPTLAQLQDQRDHRPVSPTRHSNPKGVPSVERPYSPMHDIVRDEHFRVCGPESASPAPRPRPNAGPPLFLSPGSSAAAKRAYISSSPYAYH